MLFLYPIKIIHTDLLDPLMGPERLLSLQIKVTLELVEMKG